MKQLLVTIWKRYLVLLSCVFSIFSLLNLISVDHRKVETNHTDSTWSGLDTSDDHFQSVGNDFYVYSAYINEMNVKVIGMRSVNIDVDAPVWCSLVMDSVNREDTVRADIYEVSEKRRSVIFVPIIITCDFRLLKSDKNSYAGMERLINSITEVRIARNVSSALLRVHRVPTTFSQPYVFAKCVPILYGDADLGFIEAMFAMNAKFGVDHFQIYAHPRAFSQVRAAVRRRSLETPFVVMMKLWSIPANPFEIYYYGQLVMLQDCLYSLRNRARFIFIADMDEYLLPLQQTLRFMPLDTSNSTLASWVFASVQNANCFVDDGKGGMPSWRLSKYVILPGRVRCLGVHGVVAYENDGFTAANVSTDQAVVVHCSRAYGHGQP